MMRSPSLLLLIDAFTRQIIALHFAFAAKKKEVEGEVDCSSVRRLCD